MRSSIQEGQGNVARGASVVELRQGIEPLLTVIFKNP